MDRVTAIKYPPLYKSLQKGRDMNVKTFLIWIWKSLYQVNSYLKPFFLLPYFIQGGIILLASLYLFDMVFLNIVLITFSSLILTEFLNVYSEVPLNLSLIVIIFKLLIINLFS